MCKSTVICCVGIHVCMLVFVSVEQGPQLAINRGMYIALWNFKIHKQETIYIFEQLAMCIIITDHYTIFSFVAIVNHDNNRDRLEIYENSPIECTITGLMGHIEKRT